MGEKQEDKAPDSQCTEEPYLSPGKAKPNVASRPLRKKGQPFAEGCPFLRLLDYGILFALI
jgi:hypothetical protein